MGLGDDYKDVTQNGQTVSVPITRDGSKRAGTIMATNGAKKIDQQDVQRLGNQIKKAGHKLPDLCQVTYDVTVSVSQSTQTTNAYPSGDVDTAGSEDITETWVGIFDNWPEVLEKEPGGIYIESRGDDSEGFWGGSTQGEIKFNETQNDYGGPCSGDIKTPLYGASAGWNGGPPASGAPVLSFHSSLSDADADAFTALVSSQEHADCPARNSLYPPYEPLSTGPFDAYPEWGGGLLVSGGTRWSASPSAMADGFDHLTGASFEPDKMLAHGASTSLFSGTFTDLTTGCTDSLCTFNYGANMSVIFRRVD